MCPPSPFFFIVSTVLKDHLSCCNYSVAFVLFVSAANAHRITIEMNDKLLNERTLSDTLFVAVKTMNWMRNKF